jgi:flavin reductase
MNALQYDGIATARQSPFSTREFRDAMGRFATGVVVISTRFENGAHAMTANAFMSGSLQPPLVLVSVALTARMHDRIRLAGEFGISVLGETQQQTSNHFAGRPTPDHAPAFEELAGLPVVAGALVQATADLRHDYPCGDHTLFIGELRALRAAPRRAPPLLFHGGRYSALGRSDDGGARIPEGFWASHEHPW